MGYTDLLLLGAIAGFTIYLGLPVAVLVTKPRFRAFMTAVSAGVLIFLLVEISHKSFETVEEAAKGYFTGATGSGFWLMCVLFLFGFIGGLYGLAVFDQRFRGNMDASGTWESRSRYLSTMIATGIGLHNLGEGLAIGQEYVSGAFSLAYLLIVGFALHNATEGFGIAAPLRMEKADWKFLGVLGLIGGGPTFVGVIIGSFYSSYELELLALSLAAGSILYVVGELMYIGKLQEHPRTVVMGIIAGFLVSFASDAFIEVGMAVTASKEVPARVFKVEASEYRFIPSGFEAKGGETIRFEVTNTGKEVHEFEFPELKIEAAIEPGGRAFVTVPHVRTGTWKIICDIPGHMEKGMTGELTVKPAG